jgi:hypothetical protein
LAIVEQSAVERLATLLEREVALEAVARELPTGKRRAELLAELVELRNLIKALKSLRFAPVRASLLKSHIVRGWAQICWYL